MDNDVRELLERARAPVRKKEEKRPQRDNRYIYGGEPARTAAAAPPRQNRKAIRRRISTFNTIILLFGGGILIVLYVHNIITINRLAAEVGQLQARYDSVLNTNASLRAEVNRKAAWERVGKTATEQLGLIFPTDQPATLALDQDALARAREQGRLNDEANGATARVRNDGSTAHTSSR